MSRGQTNRRNDVLATCFFSVSSLKCCPESNSVFGGGGGCFQSKAQNPINSTIQNDRKIFVFSCCLFRARVARGFISALTMISSILCFVLFATYCFIIKVITGLIRFGLICCIILFCCWVSTSFLSSYGYNYVNKIYFVTHI